MKTKIILTLPVVILVALVVLLTNNLLHETPDDTYHFEPIRIYKNQPIEMMIRDVAERNGCDAEVMVELAVLESGVDPNIKIYDSDKLYSYGLYMYHLWTFTEQLNKHNLIGKKLSYEEARDYIMLPRLQARLVCEMLKDGQEYRWENSFKKINSK